MADEKIVTEEQKKQAEVQQNEVENKDLEKASGGLRF